MTIDEAKEILEEIKLNDDCLTQYIAGFDEALDMAIQALEQEPTTNNDLAVDCIDRKELLKAMDTWDKFGYTETGCFVRAPKNDYVSYIHYDDMVNCVKGMPPITPQPKTGHWTTEFNDLEGEVRFTCSSCGKHQLFGTDYCYNCGAKMVEPQESQEV